MTRYEAILARLTGEWERQAHCFIDSASDTAIKCRIFASELARLFDLLEYYQRQIFPNTAEGEFLQKHGELRGVFKKEASRASGTAVFSCKAAAPSAIPIPAGTLCTSSRGEGLMFRTTADAAIPKGGLYAPAPVESADAGAHTNLAPHLLDVLVTPIAGISSVDNSQRLDGGADAESDVSFRQRVIESYNRISNGANLAYYEQFAKSLGEIWYAKAVYTPGVSNQIDLYAENFTRTLDAGAIADLQRRVETARELGIRVAVRRPAFKRIDIDLLLKVDNLANQHPYALNAEKCLRDATLELGIGQDWSPARMAGRLLALTGIQDVAFRSPTLPAAVGVGEICTLGSASITVEKA